MGVTIVSGSTVALPPPWVRACRALCPITATLVRVDAVRGRVDASLRSSTLPAISAWRENSMPSSTRAGVATAGSNPSRAPTRAANRRIRITLRSMASTETRPSPTASTSLSPQAAGGPGMARSCEALADSTLRTPVQSLTTTPSKPHSELSGVSSRSFSVAVTPLMEL